MITYDNNMITIHYTMADRLLKYIARYMKDRVIVDRDFEFEGQTQKRQISFSGRSISSLRNVKKEHRLSKGHASFA